jgi:hypothetical protein
MGAMGLPGAPGVDGSLRIYGNGSAGAEVIAINESWLSGANPPVNIQFSDFTVNAGVTLNVPSGTVVRCTGTFTNNGTILVSTGAVGSKRSAYNNTMYENLMTSSHPGVTRQSAASAAVGTGASAIQGGPGGEGLQPLQARLLVLPGTYGGGGGGSALGFGGQGGGSFVVIAQGAIANGGAINANGIGAGGTFLGGGGGGGIVVLASKTSIDNGGTITANGGPGSGGVANSLASGGGGGGIIHFLAPTINAGATSVLGGTKGTTGVNLSGNLRSAGAGGP